jgi:outer membrane protein OmpA-like peptidoglycan-associated protein
MIPASQAPECPEVEPEIIKEIVEKPVEVEKTTIYEEIYYDINKDEVSRAEMYKVRRIVEFMKANPDAKIEVSSHADAATGTAEYNQKISERRASNVVKLLKDNGIDESRITYSAHGSSENMYKGEDMNLNRVSICTVK